LGKQVGLGRPSVRPSDLPPGADVAEPRPRRPRRGRREATWPSHAGREPPFGFGDAWSLEGDVEKLRPRRPQL